jgi:membrane protein required for colicin V production
MNLIDLAFIAVILVSALIGLGRGLVREVWSLVVWIAALGLGWLYHQEAAELLAGQIAQPAVRLGLAFVAIVLVVLILGAILGALLSRGISKAHLGGVDGALGFVFGAARGTLLVAMAVYLASLTPMPEEAWWKESQTIGQFRAMADWVLSLVPPQVQEQLGRV